MQERGADDAKAHAWAHAAADAADAAVQGCAVGGDAAVRVYVGGSVARRANGAPRLNTTHLGRALRGKP